MPIEFYHVTYEKNEESIMKNGLVPQTGERTTIANHPVGVYLFKDIDFIHRAFEDWLPDYLDIENENIIILEVSLPDEFVQKYIVDHCEDEVYSTETIPPEYLECVVWM